jgi:hypothetical protein
MDAGINTFGKVHSNNNNGISSGHNNNGISLGHDSIQSGNSISSFHISNNGLKNSSWIRNYV